MPKNMAVSEACGYYKVSELLAILKRNVESSWGDVWVAGEITNFRRPASGHLYFSLRDDEGNLRAVMFRGHAMYLGFGPEDGRQVLARGTVTIYQPRGDLQLVIQHMEPLGEGSYRLRFERLKEKLGREGLFDEDHKRPLPPFPRCVGVATSPSGAAVRDFIEIIGRRSPGVEIVISPCRVQGEEAAEEVAAAIGRLERLGGIDVIVVTRGGGSLEDLQPFNEEVLARAVAACSLPVISAVGHETDVTICDFAADLRMPTPSAAAEAVSARYEDLSDKISVGVRRMEMALRAALSGAHARLEAASPRKAAAGLRLGLVNRAQDADEQRGRLEALMRDRLTRSRQRLDRLERRVAVLTPAHTLAQRRLAVQNRRRDLGAAMRLRLERLGSRLHGLQERMEGLSPLGVLERGYSICRKLDARRSVVSAADQVTHGETIDVLLHRGELSVSVEDRRAPGAAADEENPR